MIEYKLKTTSENDVEVILPAGEDFVRTLYPESKVNAIIAASNGKIKKKLMLERYGIIIREI